MGKMHASLRRKLGDQDRMEILHDCAAEHVPVEEKREHLIELTAQNAQLGETNSEECLRVIHSWSSMVHSRCQIAGNITCDAESIDLCCVGTVLDTWKRHSLAQTERQPRTDTKDNDLKLTTSASVAYSKTPEAK